MNVSSPTVNTPLNIILPAPDTTIVVGMSGGVDSAVAAARLKAQGYKVLAVFMKNWQDDGEGCSAEEDFAQVKKVCAQLKLDYYAVEFQKEYWDHVFTHFLQEYEQGYTPNPDILCNREIKFKSFWQKALALGGMVATGHYAQTKLIAGETALLKGSDPGKDQSYFLYTLKSSILQKVCFPVGDLLKTEVRRYARELNLSNATRKDSTGICFIGERKFQKFLANYIKAAPGKIVELESGKIVGTHQGIFNYTLGQRKGLGLGGQGEPWFVVDKDPATKTVFVARGIHHPALFCDYLTANELTWVRTIDPPIGRPLTAKIRYRQADQACMIREIKDGVATVDFKMPQRAATPRQSIVFYDGDECLGGGMIIAPGPSYYKLKKTLPPTD